MQLTQFEIKFISTELGVILQKICCMTSVIAILLLLSSHFADSNYVVEVYPLFFDPQNCCVSRLPTDSVVSAYCLWIGPEHVSSYYTCNLGSDNTCFVVAINRPIRLSCLVFKINEYVCIESVCVHERHLCHWLVCVPVSGLIWCPGWRSRALTSLCSVPAVQ